MHPSSSSGKDEANDRMLESLMSDIPYIRFLGIDFDLHGSELTARLSFDQKLIGNPLVPALHGGVVAAFLEVSALIELAWKTALDVDDGKQKNTKQNLPKTIAFSVDYLRPGKPADSYARAVITRSGRRFASVHAEAWQQSRERLFAQATGHFLMPGAHD